MSSPIVIDAGSYATKAGMAGDEAPLTIFPTTTTNNNNNNSNNHTKHPIEHGIVTDWQAMEEIFKRLYTNLEVKEEEHAVLLTEAPLNPKSNREELAQVLFESLGVPAFHLAKQAPLVLYARGRKSGFILDCGDTSTVPLAIVDGFAVTDGNLRLDKGGGSLTDSFMNMLNESSNSNGCKFSTAEDREVVRDMKEKLGYVAEDVEKEEGKDKVYTLPDGKVITVGKECYMCPELLFQPFFLVSRDTRSLPSLVHKLIESCDRNIRKELYANIIISGGNSMFPGFPERLEKELAILAPAAARVRVRNRRPERLHTAWTGGSILASLSTFRENMCVSKEEYEEFGPSVVHRKFK